MKLYQVIIMTIIILFFIIIGYFFDKNEKDPLKEKIFDYRRGIMIVILISSFILCLTSGVMVFSWAYKNEESEQLITDYYSNPLIIKESKENIIIKNEVVEETEGNEEEIIVDKIDVNFEYLLGVNPDTVAWLKVDDTNINYPVVKSTDNSYYLKKSFNNTENSAGWIFADYRNGVNGEDQNLIFYGHNRINGTMFGTLARALTQSWVESQKEHFITVVTPDYYMIYQIFSAYSIEPENYYLKTSFISDPYLDFINELKSRSQFDFGVDVTENDQIITLSTCSMNNTKRTVVHAKLILKEKNQ